MLRILELIPAWNAFAEVEDSMLNTSWPEIFPFADAPFLKRSAVGPPVDDPAAEQTPCKGKVLLADAVDATSDVDDASVVNAPVEVLVAPTEVLFTTSPVRLKVLDPLAPSRDIITFYWNGMISKVAWIKLFAGIV